MAGCCSQGSLGNNMIACCDTRHRLGKNWKRSPTTVTAGHQSNALQGTVHSSILWKPAQFALQGVRAQDALSQCTSKIIDGSWHPRTKLHPQVILMAVPPPVVPYFLPVVELAKPAMRFLPQPASCFRIRLWPQAARSPPQQCCRQTSTTFQMTSTTEAFWNDGIGDHMAGRRPAEMQCPLHDVGNNYTALR